MKYASSYRQMEQHADVLDIIHFSRISQLMELTDIDYYKEYCLEILKVGSIEFNHQPTTMELYHDMVLKKFPELRLDFYDLTDLYVFASKYGNENIHYSYHYPAEDYNMLHTLLDLGVSDIVISEPLVFEIENTNEIIKSKRPDCKIHIRPYLGKPGWMLSEESILHHFWVMPQHIYLYEDYVDVIDLFSMLEKREHWLVVYYAERKEYLWDLNPIIENGNNSDKEMQGGWITLKLAEKRLNCRQICMKYARQKCHSCDQALTIFQQLKLGHHKPASERDNDLITKKINDIINTEK